MPFFEPGKVINTCFGTPAKIVKYLAGGGQGDVYIVEYGGKEKALKWYKPQALRDLDAYYDILKFNVVEKGSPGKIFLWPIAVTERTEGSFGYIMDLIPKGYYQLTRILASSKYNFASFNAATEACIRIASSFWMLHKNGYSYQSLDDGNFLIEPETGDVLIIYDDNIAYNGTNTGVFYKPRYMAPEIVVGKGKVLTNTQSDRYSLSAILFLILFMSHPLEGKRWLVPCLTDEIAEKLYGSEPLFIYDPDNDANRPIKNIHVNVVKRWSYMPQYLKDAFLTAFSQQALKNPDSRLAESDWLKILIRFKSDIVKCSCGNEVFMQKTTTTICDNCGEPVIVKNIIKLPEYSINATNGLCVYRCQLETCNAYDALDPVLLVEAKPDGILGVKNMTQNIFNVQMPDGRAKQIQPQETIPFKQGIKIEAFDKTIELN